MKTTVFIGTSLDGFIARADGALDFLPPGGGEPHGYDEFMATVDALVIGRKTFETVLTFDTWPYAAKRVLCSALARSPPLHPARSWSGWRVLRPTSCRNLRLAASITFTWMAGIRFSGFCGLDSFNGSSSPAFRY